MTAIETTSVNGTAETHLDQLLEAVEAGIDCGMGQNISSVAKGDVVAFCQSTRMDIDCTTCSWLWILDKQGLESKSI